MARNIGEAVDGSETQTIQTTLQDYKIESFSISTGDNPSNVLVTSLLDGNNYLSWSRSMVIGLKANNTLGFINGDYDKPEEDEALARKCGFIDNMVIAWILNSLMKKINDSFLVVTAARDLWEELKERYGESSGLHIYQLMQEINNLRQGNKSVTTYFTKLKRLWNDVDCLMPIKICVCDAEKYNVCVVNKNRLM